MQERARDRRAFDERRAERTAGGVLHRRGAGARQSARCLRFPRVTPGCRLPQGGRVGTSSPRRQAQLRHARPDLQLELLRGNVDTRLRRLDEGATRCDPARAARGWSVSASRARHRATRSRAVVAGRWPGRDRHRVPYRRCTQSRSAAVIAPCRFLYPAAGRARVARHAGWQLSFADRRTRHARRRTLGSRLIGAPDGSERFRDRSRGPDAEAVELGVSLACRMLAAGAAALLERLRQEAATAS